MIKAAELDAREIDRRIARFCGYRVISSNKWPTDKRRLPRGKKIYHLVDHAGTWAAPNYGGVYGWGWTETPEEAWQGVPQYCTDRNNCREALLKLPPNKQSTIVDELIGHCSVRAHWKLLIAAPRAICEAIVVVMKLTKERT